MGGLTINDTICCCYLCLFFRDALDYNDIGLMSQYGPEDRNDADAGSFKQDNENQKPAKESGEMNVFLPLENKSLC